MGIGFAGRRFGAREAQVMSRAQLNRGPEPSEGAGAAPTDWGAVRHGTRRFRVRLALLRLPIC